MIPLLFMEENRDEMICILAGQDSEERSALWRTGGFIRDHDHKVKIYYRVGVTVWVSVMY